MKTAIAVPDEEEPKNFNIRVLNDGKFILSAGMDDEYAYDTVDELLASLKSDLEGAAPKDSGDKSKKSKIKKMMGMEDQTDEEN